MAGALMDAEAAATVAARPPTTASTAPGSPATSARPSTLSAWCIGHVPPRFAPALPYTLLCPQPLGVPGEQVIDDARFGAELHGAALAEYSQLFGLQDLIEAGDVVADRLYLFQYRKFVGLRPGGQAANAPWVRVLRPGEAPALFPSAEQLLALPQPVLVGSLQALGSSMAQHYAAVHVIEDLVVFAACLADAGFDVAAVRRFAAFQGLIPSPALCAVDVPVFLAHMRILRAVWRRFAREGAVRREGYQRRVAGYLLERLHSQLLCEGLLDGSQPQVALGHRFVVLDGEGAP
jgi:hypothetical protein